MWLTQAQIAELYNVDRSRITRHINNILTDNELPILTCAENAHVKKEGDRFIVIDENMCLAHSDILVKLTISLLIF